MFPDILAWGGRAVWWTSVLHERSSVMSGHRLINPLHEHVINSLVPVLAGEKAEPIELYSEGQASASNQLSAVSAGEVGAVIVDRYLSRGYELPDIYLETSLPVNQVMVRALKGLDQYRNPAPTRGVQRLVTGVARATIYRAAFDWALSRLAMPRKDEPSKVKRKQTKTNSKKKEGPDSLLEARDGQTANDSFNDVISEAKAPPKKRVSFLDWSSDHEVRDTPAGSVDSGGTRGPVASGQPPISELQSDDGDSESNNFLQALIRRSTGGRAQVPSATPALTLDVSGEEPTTATVPEPTVLESTVPESTELQSPTVISRPPQKVLVLGQKSSGKTSFLQYLTGHEAGGDELPFRDGITQASEGRMYKPVNLGFGGADVEFAEVTVGEDRNAQTRAFPLSDQGLLEKIAQADSLFWCADIRQHSSAVKDEPVKEQSLYKGVVREAKSRGKDVFTVLTHADDMDVREDEGVGRYVPDAEKSAGQLGRLYRRAANRYVRYAAQEQYEISTASIGLSAGERESEEVLHYDMLNKIQGR